MIGNRSIKASKTSLRKPSLRADFFDLWQALKAPFEGYRPERHYMRGPGPKCSEKGPVQTPATVNVPGLARTTV